MRQKEKTITPTAPSKPTSPTNKIEGVIISPSVAAPVAPLSSKLFGDSIEAERQEQTAQLTSEQEKEFKLKQEAIDKAIQTNIGKFQDAYTKTLAEVMGKELPKEMNE